MLLFFGCSNNFGPMGYRSWATYGNVASVTFPIFNYQCTCSGGEGGKRGSTGPTELRVFAILRLQRRKLKLRNENSAIRITVEVLYR